MTHRVYPESSIPATRRITILPCREISDSILQLGLSDQAVKQIYCGNAERLMKMSLG